MQTYQALNQPAKEICDAVFQEANKKANIKNVVFIDTDDALKFTQYQVIKNQMDDLLGKTDKSPITIKTVGLALYSADVLINSVTAFSKLFRTDREIFSEDVTIEPSAWSAALFNQCSQTKTKDQKIDFKIASMGFDAKLLLGQSDFLKKVTELKVIKAVLEHDDQTAKDDDLKAKVELILTALYKDNGVTLSQLLQSEYLDNQITSKDQTLIAKTQIVKSTGFTMKTSNIWRSDRLYSSGAVAVVYSLSDNKGTVLASDIVINETELKEVQKSP